MPSRNQRWSAGGPRWAAAREARAVTLLPSVAGEPRGPATNLGSFGRGRRALVDRARAAGARQRRSADDASTPGCFLSPGLVPTGIPRSYLGTARGWRGGVISSGLARTGAAARAFSVAFLAGASHSERGGLLGRAGPFTWGAGGRVFAASRARIGGAAGAQRAVIGAIVYRRSRPTRRRWAGGGPAPRRGGRAIQGPCWWASILHR